jgi:uncharacterized protein YbjT (DUF2867 family)
MRPTVVFVTGGTGYVGRALIEQLLTRKHVVHALARSGSERKLPDGAVAVTGNALDGMSFASAIPRSATVVHLVGTPHPSPAKAAEFERVDLVSIRAASLAATAAGASHFVYVSVAHPAPVMHAYIAVREQGEALVGAIGIPATILRPWYVLGPGHYWPGLLIPFYALGRLLPATRDQATRLGLVTLRQMVTALTVTVENPPSAGVRIMDVPAIQQAQLPAAAPGRRSTNTH